MSPKPNKALYVREDGQFIIRNDVEHESLAPNELLVETRYSGVNPADIKHSTHLGIKKTVLGYDFAGRVLKAPAGSEFKEGDAVAGYTPSGLGRKAKYGAHQSVLAVPSDLVFKIPSNLPEPHAAALTSVGMTAADIVHNLFKFPLPSNPGDISSPILIWGASSAVGLCTLQLARASGCKNIFVTASPARHELLKSLGATHAFDYSSPSVVADIKSAVEALGKGPLTHAVDTAGTSEEGSGTTEPTSADMTAQCASESTELASVVLRRDKKFKFPVAMTKDVFRIHPPGAPGPIDIPPRPTDHWKAWSALQWAVANYDTKFKLPSVSVLDVTAEEALKELMNVANGKRGFGKIVLQHPLK
ncbi:alcohol dehydrogenase [Fusarium beomiforme]|uniref:Alcohol dehydrogenase n=1 Tax=Fusarium beomiforme TaxID=44412 RepID=A0A9P5DR87_9HYPO|nr:alcohol dehydrogenase [Fusarium beomiforme]